MDSAIKTTQTPLLDVAYREFGVPGGPPVLLLHGWPDGPGAWDTVAESLARAGKHVLVPALRGFGETRFRDPKTLRSGQSTAMAQDAIDFMDALGIERFTLAGHDWGARTAYQMAANWPERLKRLVVLSIPYRVGGFIHKVSPAQQRAFWYQWLFQTNQARNVLEQMRDELCRELWQTWMAPGYFDEAEFQRTIPEWDNPDWIDVTLSFYRFRWHNDAGDPRYDALESVQLRAPKITVPTILLHGALDGAGLPQGTEGEEGLFDGPYRRILIPGAGHFLPREAPDAVAEAILSPD